MRGIRLLLACLALVIMGPRQCVDNSNLSEQEALRTLYVLAVPRGSLSPFTDPNQIDAMREFVRSFYLGASYQKIKIVGTHDGTNAGDVAGPIESDLRIGCDGEEDFLRHVIANDLDASVRLSDYDRLVFIAPTAQSCDRGFGFSLGSPTLETANGPVMLPSVFIRGQELATGTAGAAVAHELGHTFGLQHAWFLFCTPGTFLEAGCWEGEYLDILDIMGTHLSLATFNVHSRDILDWIKPESILEIERSGRYFLTPLESESLGPKLAKIQRQSDQTLYLEYRTQSGFPQAPPGLAIRLVRPNEVGTPTPYLMRSNPLGLDTLTADAGGFVDPRGHRITVLRQNAGGILFDVELTVASEYDPPELEIETTSRSIGSVNLVARDPSGIARIEIFGVQRPPIDFDAGWTRFTPLASLEPSDASTEYYEIPVNLTGWSTIRAYAYDTLGNVALDSVFVAP